MLNDLLHHKSPIDIQHYDLLEILSTLDPLVKTKSKHIEKEFK